MMPGSRPLSVAACFLAGLLVAFQSAALASVDVPAKAVWSVTDIDSLQFCHKCNPDDVLPATRVENYRRTIIDTVAMGARQIIVHARSGPGRAARVGEFAAALAAYNATASAADRACMAIMYADYGASHTDSEITALFSTAWDTSGANYCAVASRPVVATLDDRPDQTCVPAKITNIINRLRTLPSGVAPTAVDWVAGFGERSEYTSWDADCRGKITGPGIPVAYSYLEMANDDPQFSTDAATRRDSVKATGGRYILGLPSASAQNCGDFCGTDADADGYRHTDFGGFSRLLGAWRAGADNVAYTFGPGGPYGRDQFASSAVRCDANDLATSAADCAAIAMADEPLIPGVPGDGTIIINEPDDPDPGEPDPDCAASPPPPAAALGYTKLDFCDGFKFDSIARGPDAAGRKIGGKKKWTIERSAVFGGSEVNPASDFTHLPATGEMQFKLTANKYQSAIQSVNGKQAPTNGYWIESPVGWYVEIKVKMTKQGSTSQFAFWSMDMCHWSGGPNKCSTLSPANYYLEPDWVEYPFGQTAMWRHNEPSDTDKAVCYNSQGGGVFSLPIGTYKTHGVAVVKATNDVRRFVNNAQQSPIMSPSSRCGNIGATWSQLWNGGKYPLLLGGRPGDEFIVDYIRVWKKP